MKNCFHDRPNSVSPLDFQISVHRLEEKANHLTTVMQVAYWFLQHPSLFHTP